MRPANYGRVVSVNVGRPRTVPWKGRRVRTAIWKEPVAGRVEASGVNLAGDGQADRRVHGGADKAVYAYAVEDYAWWAEELGRALAFATFGENLTTEEIDLAACVIGERWQVGRAVFEVAQPRFPCFKLGIRMDDAAFVDRFDAAGRTGAYLRIVAPGDVGAGDEIHLLSRPDHHFTVGDVVAAGDDNHPELLTRMVTIPDLPEKLRRQATRLLARQKEQKEQKGQKGSMGSEPG